jgi:hypothetical protein
MGVERRVEVSTPPSWPTIAARLKAQGLDAPLRMIDGLPAFPEEQPGDGWQELRIGTPAGMITLRREPEALRIIGWGNLDSMWLDAVAEAVGRAQV